MVLFRTLNDERRPSAAAVQPGGADATFDGLGGAGTRQCIRATKRGGIVVGYGFVAAQKDGRSSMPTVLRGIAALYLGARVAGRRSTFYGITRLYRKDHRPFKEDLAKLFALQSFHFSVTQVLRGSVLGGIVLVALGTGINVVAAVLYNLIADVVGGVEITVLEEDPTR